MTPAIGNAQAARIRARQRQARPWEHPAVAGVHAVSMTRDHAGGEICSVATCQCGWRSRAEVSEIADQEIAVNEHWRDVIAAAAGKAA